MNANGRMGTTSPKNEKIDLRAGSGRGASPSNSPGCPGTRGCFLREGVKKSVRFRWSVGCDHSPKVKNVTCELVLAQVETL